MTKLILHDIDTIFISYDEPNADKNYTELLKILPWAKRIHGVKGSDAAHKEAAKLSETERFITIDADNVVDSSFYTQDIELTEETKDCVLSWCGRNIVNGLVYGNGGIKCWTKDFVLNMKTHENADNDDPESAIEFCFDKRYYQLNECYSTSYINGSPFQAWRAGFREGVKMSLDRGSRVDDLKKVWWQNYQRLKIWCTVGADVKNGLWSILGAREGCYLTAYTKWDHTQVRDFEYLRRHYNSLSFKVDENNIHEEILKYGENLRAYCNLEIAELDEAGSKFFKSVYHNMPRVLGNNNV